MLTEILIAIFALICLLISYRYAMARPEGFPPGPPRLPLFGSYPFLLMTNRRYLYKAILKFSKWYKSSIVGFFVGDLAVVAVNDPKTVKEVLVSEDFIGRPQGYLSQMRDPRGIVSGILFQEGVIWREQRRFILRYMRDFGFGRRSDELESIIQEELQDFLNLIRRGPKYDHEREIVHEKGYRIKLPIAFGPLSMNSLFQVMRSERVPRADQARLIKLIRMAFQFQLAGDEYGTILGIVPWIGHILPEWSSYNAFMESNRFVYEYFDEFIGHHIKTFEDGYERNFLDLYIKEMKEAEAAGDTEREFVREQFIVSMLDFSFPALTSFGAQLSLLIQRLILCPEILRHVQREIDEVVGSGRLPTLDDRKDLPYTEATLREAMRFDTLIPAGVPHKAVEDTQISGHNIPKDTIVIPNIYALHMSEELWGDPQNFRPERFLDSSGRLALHYDHSLPFGAGKRLCAGETFARNLMFLTVAGICQNFNFVLAPGDKAPDTSKNITGLIVSPPEFWVQLEERNV